MQQVLFQLTVCSCHVTYVFQSESTAYSCLNVKELLARRSHKIWRLSDCSWTWTQNHLVLKRTLNHLAKLITISSNKELFCLTDSPSPKPKKKQYFWIKIVSYVYNNTFFLILYFFLYSISFRNPSSEIFLYHNDFTVFSLFLL